MEKYGYEQEQDESGVKKASKEGVCPVCGEKVTGNPPVCPKHGSEPFEKRDHERKS